MKKVFLVLTIGALTFTSCEKDEVAQTNQTNQNPPTIQPPAPSNVICGTVVEVLDFFTGSVTVPNDPSTGGAVPHTTYYVWGQKFKMVKDGTTDTVQIYDHWMPDWNRHLLPIDIGDGPVKVGDRYCE